MSNPEALYHTVSTTAGRHLVQKPQVPARMPRRGPRTGASPGRRKNSPPPVPTSPEQAPSPVSEQAPAGRLSLRGGCKSPRERAGTQPTRPHGAVPGGVPPPSPDPERAPAAQLMPWTPRSTCLPFFSLKDRRKRPGAARRGGRSQTLGCLPRRTRTTPFLPPKGETETVQRVHGPKPSPLWSFGYCSQGWSIPAPEARARTASRFAAGVREGSA